jgi:predicted  nucleic acid-binding Zn-ribbon protein
MVDAIYQLLKENDPDEKISFDEYKTLQNELDQVRWEVEDLENELEDKGELIESLEDVIEELKKQIQEHVNTNKKLICEINDLSTKIL